MTGEQHPHPDLQRLDVLTGTWATEGETVATATEPSIRIAGTDEYEWLAGRFFLVHRVDVRMGDDHVVALELIGERDPASGTFAMRAFDDHGNVSRMRAGERSDGAWTFTGDSERATLVIAADGATMTARWERTDDGSSWRHWMDMRFAKVDR